MARKALAPTHWPLSSWPRWLVYAHGRHSPIMPSQADEEIWTQTEKMDGEDTTIHAGGSHARSPDSRYHPSRDWLKAFAAGVSRQLSEGERIIGENLY